MKNNKKVFLASFQKSGNTWLSFLIANIYNLIEKKYPEVNFHNIHDINPEYKKGIRYKRVFPDFPLIQTTHETYKEVFENVILLLRDPRDLLLSYYFYLEGERNLDLTLSEVVKHEKYGVRAITSHISSFIKSDANILLITYESLHKEIFRIIVKIVEFIGIGVKDSILAESVKRSSFRSMRKTEIEKGRKFGNPSFIFTREGKTGKGKKRFHHSEELSEYIRSEVKKVPLLYFLYY